MTSQEKLVQLLGHEFYQDVKRRVENNSLCFEIGEQNWPEGWYRDPYGKVSLPVAVELAARCPEITLIRIYYHRNTDFHHIRFVLGGEEYIIRWYKTFILCRKSDGHEIDFGFRDHDVIDSLARGLHRRPTANWRAAYKSAFAEG